MSELVEGQALEKLPRPKLKLPGIGWEVVSTLIFVIAVTVLFDLAIPRSLVDGHSMEPTFFGDDRLVVSRVNYLFGRPERGDIVVFNSLDEREAAQGIMLIKRVVGLPSETVTIRDATMFVNGVEFDEPYIKEACLPSDCRDNEWVLGENEYFVMGDNRNASKDSRRFGPVNIDHIVGEVIFRYWPLQTFGFPSG